MSGVAVERAACVRPWLAPAERSLLALTAEPADLTAAANDPALVLIALRANRPSDSFHLADILTDPNTREAAARGLTRQPYEPSLFASERGLQAVHLGQTAAAIAATLSTHRGDMAGTAALLAPLGWYLLAIEDGDPCPLQAHRLMQAAVHRWQLPAWLGAILSNLSLPHHAAVDLGADEELDRIVRAAVKAAEERIAVLKIAADADEAVLEQARQVTVPLTAPAAEQIARNPLVPQLLRASAAARRRSGSVQIQRLETENDRLRDALRTIHDQFDVTLRDAKLKALAELAAGAGHEINNPLAVISGHCQRILAREEDEDNRKALGTVIRQTMRVHGILRGMMQFARPSAPQPMSTRLVDLIEDVIGELTDLTADRDVEVALEINAEIPSLIVDPGQIKTCLHHLIRNAIEASGRQGWVRVSLERRDDDGIQVVIEDNGLSPSPEQVRHLFDPFYSGRSAGRGRGLGLSIAWRLAQLHGGDVRYEPVSHGPTRFVLTLPLAVPHSLPIRKAG